MEVLVPVSVGELIDKITILRIKAERISDPAKVANVRTELEQLTATAERLNLPDGVRSLEGRLKAINAELWDIEDGKRRCEREQRFDDGFIQLARQVYLKNDERAALKREINLLTGSAIVEEKQHG
ncbi:DUF6165 family protein [Brevundimonas sp. 2R-24]|uniref:DUF6165 family protein n=1 Tax=Peiella sedimenti TaxID=3061083 RepID=A0ABT8SJW7_9CAUL|nr:DUF6165 family protein [Caulobacteraceae bacterium XZ-24]